MDFRLDAASREAMLQDDVREQRDIAGTKLLYTPEEAAGSLAMGRSKLFESPERRHAAVGADRSGAPHKSLRSRGVRLRT